MHPVTLLLWGSGLNKLGALSFPQLAFSFLGRGDYRGVGVFSLPLASPNTLPGGIVHTGEERGESVREERGEGLFSAETSLLEVMGDEEEV